jgi:hypothetical protein
MQPILAESVPRGRALVIAAVFTVVAAIAATAAMAPRGHHGRWHRQYRLTPAGQCTYVYVVR